MLTERLDGLSLDSRYRQTLKKCPNRGETWVLEGSKIWRSPRIRFRLQRGVHRPGAQEHTTSQLREVGE